jgi:hypothetical protein
MKSIDIRSEPAVRLLADFLDERGSTGRDRRGAEQFAHGRSIFLFAKIDADKGSRGLLVFEESV